jgi:hypothetical protein
MYDPATPSISVFRSMDFNMWIVQDVRQRINPATCLHMP